MSDKKRGLGRGLSALLPREEPPEGVRTLPIQQLVPNRHQPRTRFDDEGLEALVGGAPADLSAQELADLVVEHALAFQEGVPRDDIAVVVLRHP